MKIINFRLEDHGLCPYAALERAQEYGRLRRDRAETVYVRGNLSGMPGRRVAFALISVVLGALGAFVIAEVGLRLLYISGYGSPLPPGIRDLSEHRLNYVRFRPNSSGTAQGVEYRTNEFGYRSDPIVVGAKHVVFLGDSTTFGLSLQQAETFPAKVEQLLNERAEKGWQALNTATPGQGTLDELDTLRRVLDTKEVAPRLIVLGFFVNDFSDNQTYLEFTKRHTESRLFRLKFYLYQFRIVLLSKEALKEVWYWWDRSSVYKEPSGIATAPKPDIALLDEAGQYKALPGKEIEWNWVPAYKLPGNRVYRITTDALAEISALARAQGIPILLLYLPYDDRELSTGFEPEYKVVLKRTVEHLGNIEFVDPIPRLRQRKQSTSDPNADFVGHPGPEAAAAIADVIVDRALALPLSKN
jgi:hypothetical protein